MAQNQGGGGQNSGGNQGGQNQKKQPNFPRCPQCGTRPLPKDKEACPICRPEYEIDAATTRGENKWQLIVETYKNGVETKVSFAIDIDGRNLFIISAIGKRYWKEDGLAVIPLEFSSKGRKATFRIIGGNAKVKDIEIPAEKPAGFKPAKPDKGESFWKNLRKGLKG